MHADIADGDVAAQTAAALAAPPRQVIVAAKLERQAAQGDVAVDSALQTPVLAEAEAVPEPVGEEARLVVLRRAALDTENFLQGDDVAVEFRNHVGNARGAEAPVETAALVDVVSGDANVHC